MGHETSGIVEERRSRTSSEPRRGTSRSRSTRSSAAAPASTAVPGRREPLRPAHACTAACPRRPAVYAETMTVPARTRTRCTRGRRSEWGALVEPLTVGVARRRASPADPDGDACWSSAAASSASAPALAARRRGGDRVLVLEPRPERRELCEPAGAAGAASRRRARRRHVRRGARLRRAARDASAPRSAPSHRRRRRARRDLAGRDPASREPRSSEGDPDRSGPTATRRRTSPTSPPGSGAAEVDLSPIIEHRVGFDGVIDAFDALRRRLARRGPHAVPTGARHPMNFELPDDVQGLVGDRPRVPRGAPRSARGGVPARRQRPVAAAAEAAGRGAASAGSGRSTSPRSTAGSAWASSRSARSTRSSTGTR